MGGGDLAAKVRDQLQNLITGLDGLRVELEGPLRGDQVNELLHGLDVRGFESPSADLTHAIQIGITCRWLPGRLGSCVQVVSQLEQPLGIGERGDFERVLRSLGAIEHVRHHTIGGDAEISCPRWQLDVRK